MTITLAREKFRNAADNATIYIEKYIDRIVVDRDATGRAIEMGWSKPAWKILLVRDGSSMAGNIKRGLLRKPSKKRIQDLIDTL